MADINNPRDSDSVARQPGAFGVGAAGPGLGQINPELEDRYWRENYSTRPYVQADRGYEFYGPAYRHGWESRARYHGKTWAEVEPDVRTHWEERSGSDRGESKAQKAKNATVGMWDEIKDAVKEGWEHAIHP
jgi:hypothetical protein